MGAAPACRHIRGAATFLASAALAALATLGLAQNAAPASTTPSALWGIESVSSQQLLGSDLVRLHKQGVSVLVVDPAHLSAARRRTLAADAQQAGMLIAFPRRAPASSLRRFCRAERRSPGHECAVLAGTPRAAVLAARRNVADLVVFHLRSLAQLRMLRGVRATTHILALARIPAGKLDQSRWARAVAIAEQDATLDLAVTVSSVHQPALKTFLGVVAAGRGGKQTAGVDAPGGEADALPPTSPLALAMSTASQTSVTLTWLEATDNTGVAGYTVYRNGSSAGSTILTSFGVAALTCGTSYELAVEAYDAAGNRSPRTTLTTSTSACGAGGDSNPPSAPTGLAKTGSTATVVSLSWTASTDAVGVVGYGIYRAGTLQSNVSGTSAGVTGLSCGTSYSFSVDAFDAAGNRSAKTTLAASTSACAGDTQAPSAPGALSVTGSTTTSITVSWGAAADNVGVTGYGLYRGGTSVGSSGSTTATFGGLACGTSYSLAVDAVDAAGNRSSQVSTSASTAACAGGGGGGGSATVFVSTSGSDGNPCTQSQPCLSFNRAYAVAPAGATIEVAGGSYASQTIDSSSPNSGANIVFRPASGASVTLGDLEVTRGAHVEFRDFTVSGDTYNRAAAQYVTYRRIDMGLLYIRGADHISYIGGSVGPNNSSDYMNWITEPSGSSDPAQDILLDGISIHDFTKHNAGSHVDCLGLGNSDRITIRNSRFWNCEHFAIIPGKDPSGGSARDLVIENNFIDCCVSGYYSIGLGDAAGVTIRFNSISDAGIGWLGGTVTNVVIDSNVIDNNNGANCSNATWSYNVVATGSACGGILAPSGFALPPLNLRLNLGAAAINAGNPTNYPSTDIDGHARPAGGRPDAGAQEAG